MTLRDYMKGKQTSEDRRDDCFGNRIYLDDGPDGHVLRRRGERHAVIVAVCPTGADFSTSIELTLEQAVNIVEALQQFIDDARDS